MGQPCNWPDCNEAAEWDTPLNALAKVKLEQKGLRPHAWAFLCGKHYALFGIKTSVTKRLENT